MSALAVDGCSLEISSGIANANLTITTPYSTDCLVGDKGIYFGTLSIVLASGATYGGGTLAVPVTFSLKGSCEDVLEGSNKAVLEGDTSDAVASISFPIPNSSPAIATNVTVKIKSAGQSDVEV